MGGVETLFGVSLVSLLKLRPGLPIPRVGLQAGARCLGLGNRHELQTMYLQVDPKFCSLKTCLNLRLELASVAFQQLCRTGTVKRYTEHEQPARISRQTKERHIPQCGSWQGVHQLIVEVADIVGTDMNVQTNRNKSSRLREQRSNGGGSEPSCDGAVK